jgi:hypothetical protein
MLSSAGITFLSSFLFGDQAAEAAVRGHNAGVAAFAAVGDVGLKLIQLVPESGKFGDSLIDLAAAALEELSELVAEGGAIDAQGSVEQSLDARQIKAEEAGATDELEAQEVGFRIEAVARLGAGWGRNKAFLLVEPDGLRRYAGEAGDVADGQLAAHESRLKLPVTGRSRGSRQNDAPAEVSTGASGVWRGVAG